jgi:hypothetical protein
MKTGGCYALRGFCYTSRTGRLHLDARQAGDDNPSLSAFRIALPRAVRGLGTFLSRRDS